MTAGPLKIIWHGNAPWTGTGYGNQTAVFAQRLVDAGHKVIISCYYGLRGAVVHVGSIKVLPGGFEDWGNDVLPLHYGAYKPDVIMALMDIWVLSPKTLQEIPLAVWTPVDHRPLPALVHERLKQCQHPIAMSRFGEAEMRRAGIEPYYIPLGVDCKEYAPGDRAKARAKWGVDEDVFLVVMNAANKGVPSRKNFESVFKAWSAFAQKHPKSVLYVHTLPQPATHGHDLEFMVEFYEIPEGTIRFPDSYLYYLGHYDWKALSDLYNAADVLLSPSRSEGFGIPIVEAQACGCPVIVTDFSSMTELCSGGYKIPVDEFDDMEFTIQGAEWARVKPSAIITALEWALENRGNENLREQARVGAMNYDADLVMEKYMLPAFEEIAAKSKAEKTETTEPGTTVLYEQSAD